MMQSQYVMGCWEFEDRKDRRKKYHILKQEYGLDVKISVKDNVIYYTYKEVV